MLGEQFRATESVIAANTNVLLHLQVLIQLVLIVKIRLVSAIVADMVLARVGDVLLLGPSVWEVSRTS